MENNDRNDDNKKNLLEKVVFWLKINALLLLAIFVTFWIFMILL